MKVDIIIVGQGMAGTLLAFELIKRGKSIFVIDDPSQAKASKVAAGIVNPVIFRRMTKSWLVDDAFPRMESTYRELENLLDEKFYYPAQIRRILNKNDFEIWTEKAIKNKLENYIDVLPDVSFSKAAIISPLGTGTVKKAGKLDVPKLIDAFSGFLNQQSMIRNEKFDFVHFQVNQGKVIYKDLTSEKIIFCEGPAASDNPNFKALKFKNSKGEILELYIPDLKLHEIINHEVFILPDGNDRYIVGSTYCWDCLNWKNTDSATEELTQKLEKITKSKFANLNQRAGIRPTMHDRKPVVGFIPDNPQIGIFNGLGSKGVLLGPYFAIQLADHIINRKNSIHPEANVDRYFVTGSSSKHQF